MKHIVILGAGFGGVTCALELARAFGNGKGVQVTLVDKDDYHWFHADFYEVASSLEEITDISALKRSVSMPLSDIFNLTSVSCLKAEVLQIDADNQTIELQDKRVLKYDYLVSALGSRVCYYGIPGAEQYSLPLKNFRDALKIRNAIEFLVQRYRQDISKRQLRVVVVGGGFSGVELAAELAGMIDFLSWKYTYPREKIEICIIEGSGQLLSGLPVRVSRDAVKRLAKLGVRLILDGRITELGEQYMELANGERFGFDVAIWTAGVQSAIVPFKQILPKDHAGRVLVDSRLQVPKYHNILFIGDQMCVSKCPDPPTAMHACYQARYVARSLLQLLLNRQPQEYQTHPFSYVIPLGGKFAIYAGDRFYTAGFVGYLLKMWRTFVYYKSLLGFFRALQFLIQKQKLYRQND